MEQELAGSRCTFPLIAECAMNGAFGRLSIDEKEQATATVDPCGMTNKKTGNGKCKSNCKNKGKSKSKAKYRDPFDCVAHKVP
jgi:hypothetical protein